MGVDKDQRIEKDSEVNQEVEGQTMFKYLPILFLSFLIGCQKATTTDQVKMDPARNAVVNIMEKNDGQTSIVTMERSRTKIAPLKIS